MGELTPVLSNTQYDMEALSEELITIVVRDLFQMTNKGTMEFVCHSKTSFIDVFNDVSIKSGLQSESFELIFQDSNGEIHEFSKMPPEEVLSSINIFPSKQKVYSITLEGKRVKKRPVARRLGKELNAISLESECHSPMNLDIKDEPYSPLSGSAAENLIALPKRDITVVGREFCGLKNLKMTCYLNSLIQSLFFNPEFRNIVYSYEPTGTSEKKSIGVALQRLFLKLQFSCRDSVGTEDLTKTFGWKDADQSTQQDIEEMFRLLLDYLSEEFKGTDCDSIIQSLFGGILIDYVECLECRKRNSRQELFLAIPLNIRNCGKVLSEPTLEEALKSFIQYELLDQNNQYDCGQCEKKVDAHKGFRFAQFPYLLCIHLKRFEFDFENLSRVKLSDKIEFPSILNLNDMLEKDAVSEEVKMKLVPPLEKHAHRIQSKFKSPRSSHSRPNIKFVEAEEFPNEENTNAKEEPEVHPLISEALKSGPYVYQLYGVMVHRGAVSAGHYFAYISDLETNRWYRFDDLNVRRVDEQDIVTTYGKGISLSRDESKDTSTAYMLLYRRIDSNLNSLPMIFEELPDSLQVEWEQSRADDESTGQRETLEKNTIRVPVFTRDSVTGEVLEQTISFKKSDSLFEAAQFALRCFGFDPDCYEKLARLVRYDKEFDIMENSFEEREQDTIGTILKHTISGRSDCLFLEIRDEYDSFEPYNSRDTVCMVHKVDISSESITKISEVHVKMSMYISELSEKIASKMRLSTENMYILVNPLNTKVVQDIAGDDATIATLRFKKVTNIYVQNVTEDRQRLFQEIVATLINTVKLEITYQVPRETLDSTNAFTNGDGKNDSFEPKLFNTKPDFLLSPISITDDSMLMGEDEDSQIVPQDSHENDSQGTLVNIGIEHVEYDDVYYFRVLKEKTDDPSCRSYLCRVDSRMSMNGFSYKLSHLINMEESKFIIYTILGNMETEVRNGRDLLSKYLPLTKIHIRPGRRLKQGEGRVAVYLLNLEMPTEEPIRFNDYVIHEDSHLDHLNSNVCAAAMLNEICLKNPILRKKVDLQPSEILRNNLKMGTYFPTLCQNGCEIYLQIQSNFDESCPERSFSVFVRYWHPETLTLDPPVDIFVKQDSTKNSDEVILDKIVEKFNIEKEYIQVAKPDSGTYPCNLNPLIIDQNLCWYTMCYGKFGSICIYKDELVIFIRDSREKMRDLTEEEKYIYGRDFKRIDSLIGQSPFDFTPPRNEGNLKFNLALTPPM